MNLVNLKVISWQLLTVLSLACLINYSLVSVSYAGCCDGWWGSDWPTGGPVNEYTPLQWKRNQEQPYPCSYFWCECDQEVCSGIRGLPAYIIVPCTIIFISAVITTVVIGVLTSELGSDKNSTSNSNQPDSPEDIIIETDEAEQSTCASGELSIGVLKTFHLDETYRSELNQSATAQLQAKKTETTDTSHDQDVLSLNRMLCEGFRNDKLSDCSARILAGANEMRPEERINLMAYIHAVVISQRSGKAVLKHEVPGFFLSEIDPEYHNYSGYIDPHGYICLSSD